MSLNLNRWKRYLGACLNPKAVRWDTPSPFLVFPHVYQRRGSSSKQQLWLPRPSPHLSSYLNLQPPSAQSYCRIPTVYLWIVQDDPRQGSPLKGKNREGPTRRTTIWCLSCRKQRDWWSLGQRQDGTQSPGCLLALCVSLPGSLSPAWRILWPRSQVRQEAKGASFPVTSLRSVSSPIPQGPHKGGCGY